MIAVGFAVVFQLIAVALLLWAGYVASGLFLAVAFAGLDYIAVEHEGRR